MITKITKNWEIRKADPTDAHRICELLYMLKTQYASTPANSFQEFLLVHLKVVELALGSPRNLVLVAYRPDCDVIGFISLTIRTVMRVATLLGSLEEIFVCPEYRKCGIGSSLWNEASVLLRQQGITRVEVISSLAHPGQRQFAKRIGMEWYSSVHVLTI